MFLTFMLIDFEHTNILSYPSLQKSLEEQMKGEVKKHQEDLRFYVKEKWQLKKELEVLKVSVAYMHKTLQYYHISWFVACHRTIWMKIASLSSFSGIDIKIFVINIIIIIISLATDCTKLTSGCILCVTWWLRSNILTCTYKKHLQCHIDIQILEMLILFPHY